MSDTADHQLIRRVARRVLPLLLAGYLVAFIDRQNISFAKLQMVHDLGLQEAAFGLGASLFFIGYLLFEVPSNLVLVRIGPRIWLARIMATWGVVTVLLALTSSPVMFYLLRFLLGAAEAGFYPGILYLLTLWFPLEHRGRMISYFVLASVIANLIGGPLGGFLLSADGLMGLRGWEWIFLMTGLPAVVLAVVLFFSLPERPETARFLSEPDRVRLLAWLARDRATMPSPHHAGALRNLLDPRVLLLTVLFMFFTFSAYGFSYWFPTVVKSFGVSDRINGLLNILPWLCVGTILLWLPRRAGRVDDPMRNIVIPSLVGSACFVASYVLPGAIPKFVALCAAVCCIFVAQPCFWTLPGRFVSGAGAAAAIALINSVGNLGGFFGQTIVPLIRDLTGSVVAPMLLLAAVLAGRGLLTLAIMPYVLRRAAHTPVTARSNVA